TYTYLLPIIFFLKDPPTNPINTLSLHDALPISTRTQILAQTTATQRNKRMKQQMEPMNKRMKMHRKQAMTQIKQKRRINLVLARSEEHTSELQSRENLVCRLLLEKKKMQQIQYN